MGVRMIDGAGRFLKESKRGLPSLITAFFKLSGIINLLPHSKIFARYYLGHLSQNQSATIEVLSGAFMLLPKKVWEQTGGFDEQFFMYAEDIDLSYRIQMAGFTNYYFAGTTIIHFKGKSTKTNNSAYVRIFYRAMELFVQKYYNGYQLKIYRWLIRLVLRTKLLLLPITVGLNRNRANKPALLGATLIVASEKEYNSIIKWVNEYLPNALIIGQVDPDTAPSINSLGGLTDLLALIQQYQIKNIIFCIQELLTVKASIRLLESIPRNLHCYFHFAGSDNMMAAGAAIVR